MELQIKTLQTSRIHSILLTGLSITELGLDYLEDYVKQARDMVGYDVPLAIDHIGHVNYQSCLKLAKRLEKFNIFWMEDCVPWFYTDQWKVLSDSTTVPMCTGEDIFGRDAFRPLMRTGQFPSFIRMY